MPVATLIRNNRAFTEVSIPFDAGASQTHIYVASGPFEPFRKRLSFAHAEGPAGESRHFWNHRELGFGDDGARYFVKVTTENGGGDETPLVSSPALEIPRSTGLEAIPVVLLRSSGSLPTAFSDPAAVSDFVVSLREFDAFRLVGDFAVNPGDSIQVLMQTALDRAGPFNDHQVTVSSSSGVVSLKDGIFSVAESGRWSADLDVRSVAFLRLLVRAQPAAAGNQITSLNVERLKRQVAL